MFVRLRLLVCLVRHPSSLEWMGVNPAGNVTTSPSLRLQSNDPWTRASWPYGLDDVCCASYEEGQCIRPRIGRGRERGRGRCSPSESHQVLWFVGSWRATTHSQNRQWPEMAGCCLQFPLLTMMPRPSSHNTAHANRISPGLQGLYIQICSLFSRNWRMGVR